MARITLIATGGTIGSVPTVYGRALAADSPLPQLCQRLFPPDDVIETVVPYSCLSEDMTPSRWPVLCAAVAKAIENGSEAVVITHGSDTLSYTAALLGLVFAASAVPLILVAANHPPTDVRSNATDNLQAAVVLSHTPALSGCVVPWRGKDGICRVFLGTRLCEADTRTDDFHSADGDCFGTVVDGTFIYRQTVANAPFPPKGKALPQPAAMTASVLRLQPYVGLRYDSVALEQVDAVLHTLYHSSTACTDADERYSLPVFIRRCRERHIPVFLTPLGKPTADKYVTTGRLTEAGGRALPLMSREAAFVKVLLSVSGGMPPTEEDWGFETIEKPLL